MMSHSTQDSPASKPDELPNGELLRLVMLAKVGDVVAFDELYRRYYDRIHRYLTRLIGEPELGYDLAQETFLKVWRSLRNLSQPLTFSSWLYRIATNVAYDYKRRPRNRHEFSLEREEAEKVSWISSDDPAGEIEMRELVKIARARIPKKLWVCFILYHIENRSFQQIAEIVEVTEDSARTYASLGLKEFRKAYLSLANEQDHWEKERQDR